MARTCEEAANQHDRAAARCQHSAEHPAMVEHATENKWDIAVDHSDRAWIDELTLRPDGMASRASPNRRRSGTTWAKPCAAP